MRCLIYSSLALLLAAPALAASPVVDPSGGFNKAVGHTVTGGTVSNVTTTDSNDIIVALIGNNNSTNSAPKTVSTISFAGLSFTKRASNIATGCQHTMNCGVAGEVWWAYAASPIGATSFTWTWSGTTDCGGAVVFGVNGVNSFVNPWDSNGGIPSYNNDMTDSNTNANTTIATSESLDLLLGYCTNLSSSVCASAPPTGWANISQWTGGSCAGFDTTGVVYSKAVSAPQTSTTTLSGTTGDWVTIGDALTASAVPGGGVLQFQTPVSYGGDRRNLKWQER